MAFIATGGLLLLFLFFLLPDITLAQQITAAPNLAERRVGPVLRRHEVPRRRQDDSGSSSSVDSLSAYRYCRDNVPGCSSKLDLYDACEAEYDGGDDGQYLYCLCTTGYYDMMQSCDACSVSQGIKSTSLYSVGLSMDDEGCSSRFSKYGSGGGGGGTSSRSSPASGDAALTTGSGAVRSTDSAASGSEATSESFGGLIRTSGNLAAPTAVASDSASAYAKGGVRSYMLLAGMSFSLFLHQPFCE
jgi:hypothetical protein